MLVGSLAHLSGKGNVLLGVVMRRKAHQAVEHAYLLVGESEGTPLLVVLLDALHGVEAGLDIVLAVFELGEVVEGAVTLSRIVVLHSLVRTDGPVEFPFHHRGAHHRGNVAIGRGANPLHQRLVGIGEAVLPDFSLSRLPFQSVAQQIGIEGLMGVEVVREQGQLYDPFSDAVFVVSEVAQLLARLHLRLDLQPGVRLGTQYQ